ncbi:cupin domain-containing protein [Streptomyces sp. NPDC003863]
MQTPPLRTPPGRLPTALRTATGPSNRLRGGPRRTPGAGRPTPGRGRARSRLRAGPLRPAGVARAGRGDDTLLVGGRSPFGDRAQEPLLDRPPPAIRIPADSPHAETVRWALAAIEREPAGRPVAFGLVAEQLAVVTLVHVLRPHLAREPQTATGRPAGLADPVAAAAPTAPHQDPARAWTAAEPAHACAASRSALAARLKSTAGQGPWSTSRAGASSSRPVSRAGTARASPPSPGPSDTTPKARRASPSSASRARARAPTEGVRRRRDQPSARSGLP